MLGPERTSLALLAEGAQATPSSPWRAWLPLALVAALWLGSMAVVEPRAMTDLGLLSVLPLTWYAALVLLAASFCRRLADQSTDERLFAAHTGLFVAIIHATPALISIGPRYPWSYKHIGIADYILREGRVDPSIDQLDVYHNWPTFFAGDALLADLAGTEHMLTIARWAPVLFTLVTVGLLRILVRSFTADRRVIWTSIWLYFLVNWVGQEYFAPQGYAFVLYLAILALILNVTARSDPAADDPRGAIVGPRPFPARGGPERALVIGLVVVLMAAVTMSHQLTTPMLVFGLLAVGLTRRARVSQLLGLATLMAIAWAGTIAWAFVFENLESFIETLGTPAASAEENLIDTSTASAGQRLVALGGRLLTVVSVGLAVVGGVRRLRRRRYDWAPAALAGAGFALLALGSYDGEILFRVVLFSSPFVAVFAAWSLWPGGHGSAATVRAAGLTFVVLVGLAPLFLLAQYGKEATNWFSADELRASWLLYEDADDGFLIVKGSKAYPNRMRKYEQFVHVSIADEPADGIAEVVADPAGRLRSWIADNDEYTGGHVIVTRSMYAQEEALPVLGVEGLRRIEDSLRASPDFEPVFDSPDAVVFRFVGNGSP